MRGKDYGLSFQDETSHTYILRLNYSIIFKLNCEFIEMLLCADWVLSKNLIWQSLIKLCKTWVLYHVLIKFQTSDKIIALAFSTSLGKILKNNNNNNCRDWVWTLFLGDEWIQAQWARYNEFVESG